MASTGVGTQLRKLRLESGMTQAQLAEAAGVADATVSRIERGRLTPSVDLVERLAGALRRPASDLLNRSKEPKRRSLRPCERRLLAVVRDLDDARVDDVSRAIKLILSAGKHI